MRTKIEGTAFILCNNSRQGQAILRMGQFEFERRPQIVVLTNRSVDRLRGLRNVKLIMGQVPAKNIEHQEQYELFRYLMRKLQDNGCEVHWADL